MTQQPKQGARRKQVIIGAQKRGRLIKRRNPAEGRPVRRGARTRKNCGGMERVLVVRAGQYRIAKRKKALKWTGMRTRGKVRPPSHEKLKKVGEPGVGGRRKRTAVKDDGKRLEVQRTRREQSRRL